MRLSGGGLLGLAYLGFISLGLPDALLGVGWPSMRETFGVSIEAVGLILTVGVTGYLMSSVSTGFALARLGVGRLLAGSTALVAAGLAAYAAAPVFAVALVGSVLVGLGSGAIDAGLNVYAAENFGARHMNWLHASFGFGATLGPLVMTSVLGAGLGWRWGYGLTAAVQSVLAVAFALTARSWQVPRDALQEEATGEASRGNAARTLLLPTVWMGAVTFALYTGTEVAVALWTFTLLTDGRDLSTSVAGTCVAAYWGALFVGRVVYGVIADRLSGRSGLVACLAGMSAGALVAVLPAPAWVTVVGVMTIGLFAAPVFPLLTLTTADRVGSDHAGPAVGMQIGAASLGAVIFPGLLGLLVGRGGTDVIAPAFLVLTLLVPLAYLLTVRLAGHVPDRV
ncbi:MFS transporter [Virgisporangium ochraceum]|uniref:MFS transporter n=1 Tax=Virgisporangium ochraceum TaxID=65505 RepID=A0A8J3ZVF1_9ACTN|nr:MFS transporter [Virgisporangium ochraceum]GIJ68151.1 MFS transporter [Virgisporangium ochraceum]